MTSIMPFQNSVDSLVVLHIGTTLLLLIQIKISLIMSLSFEHKHIRNGPLGLKCGRQMMMMMMMMS